jgi:hypothetical protein
MAEQRSRSLQQKKLSRRVTGNYGSAEERSRAEELTGMGAGQKSRRRSGRAEDPAG